MAALSEMIDMLQAIFGAGKPDAFSRITRTPIYKGSLPQGVEARYLPKLGPFGGSIQVPQGETIDDSALRHESAHSIYDDAVLKRSAPTIAQNLSKEVAKRITGDDYYKARGITSDLLANEGLGFSVEDPTQAGFTEGVANMISNITLKKALMKLQKR